MFFDLKLEFRGPSLTRTSLATKAPLEPAISRYPQLIQFILIHFDLLKLDIIVFLISIWIFLQWMTAGRGIIHSEMPAGDGIQKGLQLWINLSSKDKMYIQKIIATLNTSASNFPRYIYPDPDLFLIPQDRASVSRTAEQGYSRGWERQRPCPNHRRRGIRHPVPSLHPYADNVSGLHYETGLPASPAHSRVLERVHLHHWWRRHVWHPKLHPCIEPPHARPRPRGRAQRVELVDGPVAVHSGGGPAAEWGSGSVRTIRYEHAGWDWADIWWLSLVQERIWEGQAVEVSATITAPLMIGLF